MKIDEILDLMDQLLDHAKPIPFASHKVIVDGDRLRLRGHREQRCGGRAGGESEPAPGENHRCHHRENHRSGNPRLHEHGGGHGARRGGYHFTASAGSGRGGGAL